MDCIILQIPNNYLPIPSETDCSPRAAWGRPGGLPPRSGLAIRGRHGVVALSGQRLRNHLCLLFSCTPRTAAVLSRAPAGAGARIGRCAFAGQEQPLAAVCEILFDSRRARSERCCSMPEDLHRLLVNGDRIPVESPGVVGERLVFRHPDLNDGKEASLPLTALAGAEHRRIWRAGASGGASIAADPGATDARHRAAGQWRSYRGSLQVAGKWADRV